jgi:hypothetical protein
MREEGRKADLPWNKLQRIEKEQVEKVLGGFLTFLLIYQLMRSHGPDHKSRF